MRRAVGVLLAMAAAGAAQDRTLSSDADVRTVVFSKDGNTLAGICMDRKLRQWDVRSGALRTSTDWAEDQRPIVMPSGSGLFALAGRDGSVGLSSFDGGA